VSHLESLNDFVLNTIDLIGLE